MDWMLLMFMGLLVGVNWLGRRKDCSGGARPPHEGRICGVVWLSWKAEFTWALRGEPRERVGPLQNPVAASFLKVFRTWMLSRVFWRNMPPSPRPLQCIWSPLVCHSGVPLSRSMSLKGAAWTDARGPAGSAPSRTLLAVDTWCPLQAMAALLHLVPIRRQLDAGRFLCSPGSHTLTESGCSRCDSTEVTMLFRSLSCLALAALLLSLIHI